MRKVLAKESKVLRGMMLTDGDAEVRATALRYDQDMIGLGAGLGAPAL